MRQRVMNHTEIPQSYGAADALLGHGECNVNGRTAKPAQLYRKATISAP